MEDIKINVRDLSPNSISSETISDDISREEEKWTHKLENFLGEIKSQCETFSKKHKIAWAILQARSNAISVVAITLPVISGALTIPALPLQFRFISTILMLSSGGIVSLQKLLQYEKGGQLHLEYSARYSELAHDIQYTLSRSRKDRAAADVTVQKYLFKQTTLMAAAPPSR